MIRLGVTGTDTGIGKTVVAAALTALARQEGREPAAMKPLETGVERGDPDTDAVLLRRAAGDRHPLEDVCPVVLPEPLAPSVAARRAGRAVSLERLDEALQVLSEGSDVVVVEGAGGLLVPVDEAGTGFDDLFRRWSLEVVIVAGNRLGVLNHTLLTVRAAREAELPIRGVVLNALASEPGSISEETNRDTLARLLPDLPLLSFPWLEDPRDPAALAAAGRAAGLDHLLRDRPES